MNIEITISVIEYVVIFQKFKLPSMYAQTVKTSEKMIILRLYTIKRLKVFVLRFMRRIVSLELWITIPKKVSKTPKHRDPNPQKIL